MSSIATLLQAAEYIERRESERGVRNKFQDLPDELILKILSYLKLKYLIKCGQISMRTRNISQDSSLWMTVTLKEKIVKTDFLEKILSRRCQILNISNSTIVGRLSSNIKSKLRVLYLSQSEWGYPIREWPAKVYYEENLEVIEELLFSCCSLQHLEMEGLCITPKMALSICKNGKTLQVLNLNHSLVGTLDRLNYTWHNYLRNYAKYMHNTTSDFQTIIKCCQELKELDLNYINENEGINDDDLEFLAENISPNVERFKLIDQDIKDDHVNILLKRCNKIKILSLEATYITNDTLKNIRKLLNLTFPKDSILKTESERKKLLHGLEWHCYGLYD